MSEPGQKPGTKQTWERPWHHQCLGGMQSPCSKARRSQSPTFLKEGMVKPLGREGKRLEDSPVLSFPLVTDKLVAKATPQMCEHTPAQQDLLPVLGKAAAHQGQPLSSVGTRETLLLLRCHNRTGPTTPHDV